jgi:hypothetical protein
MKKTLPTVVGRLYHGAGANCVTVAQASSRVSAADISRHKINKNLNCLSKNHCAYTNKRKY